MLLGLDTTVPAGWGWGRGVLGSGGERCEWGAHGTAMHRLGDGMDRKSGAHWTRGGGYQTGCGSIHAEEMGAMMHIEIPVWPLALTLLPDECSNMGAGIVGIGRNTGPDGEICSVVHR